MAREIITSTSNFTKKDVLNARNGYSLQSNDHGTRLLISRCAIILGENKEEEGSRQVAVLIGTEIGGSDLTVCFTSISETIIDSVTDLVDIIDEDGPQTITLHKRRSNSGREFLTISID